MSAKPSETPADFLEDQEFYELSQTYRHARQPAAVVSAWDALKSHIREHVRHVREGWVSVPESQLIKLWGKFAVWGGPQGPFMLYHGFRNAMTAAVKEPGATQPSPDAESQVPAPEAGDRGVAPAPGAAVPELCDCRPDQVAKCRIQANVPPDCRLAAGKEFAQQAAPSKPQGNAVPAVADTPAHIDHPLRHYDRTCPACNQMTEIAGLEAEIEDEIDATADRWAKCSSIQSVSLRIGNALREFVAKHGTRADGHREAIQACLTNDDNPCHECAQAIAALIPAAERMDTDNG